jgi:hypothetical protein
MPKIQRKGKRAKASISLHKAIFRPFSNIRVAGKANIIRPCGKTARSAKVGLKPDGGLMGLCSAVQQLFDGVEKDWMARVAALPKGEKSDGKAT